MQPTIDLLRQHLSKRAPLGDRTSKLAAGVVSVVEGDSLNVAVQKARDLRQQGRIDLSIGMLTKANRTQLDAIEGIQRAIDQVLGRPARKVILAKYRQFHPYEMGIENGDDVLALLDEFAVQHAGDFEADRARLHQLEMSRQSENERLAFFESRYEDGSEDLAIAEMRQAIESIDEDLLSLKHRILDAVLSTTTRFLSKHAGSADGSEHALTVAKWVFVLATSPILTRHADAVRTEA